MSLPALVTWRISSLNSAFFAWVSSNFSRTSTGSFSMWAIWMSWFGSNCSNCYNFSNNSSLGGFFTLPVSMVERYGFEKPVRFETSSRVNPSFSLFCLIICPKAMLVSPDQILIYINRVTLLGVVWLSIYNY